MTILNLHYEGRRPEQRLTDLLDLNPIAISIAPYQLDQFSEEDREILNGVVNHPRNFLGQQGLNHRCMFNHKFVDPWHENYCPYLLNISREDQKKLMEKGKEKLMKVFRKEPVIYIPPNHLYDFETVEVAEELGFRYLTDLNLLGILPYLIGKVIVVPEEKLDNRELAKYDIAYTHFKDIQDLFQKIKKEDLQSFADVVPFNVRYLDRLKNKVLKHSWKYFRDIKRIAQRDFSQ